MTSALAIRRLLPGMAEVVPCCRWWHEAFFRDDGKSFQHCFDLLNDFLGRSGDEAGFVALEEGRPRGLCLFVHDEIEPRHAVSPWLAGLVVDPACRGRGTGSLLVRAVEAHARQSGYDSLWLYTASAETLYVRLGWAVVERFDWDGVPFALMRRSL